MTSSAPQAVQAPTPHAGETWAMIRTLGGIALLSGCLLSLVYQATQARIARNTELRIRNAVLELLPEARTQRVVMLPLTRPDGTREERMVYAGYDALGRLAGLAIEAADGGGYGGEIRLLYGYLPDKQQIIGVTILLCRETPGLGDRIRADEAFHANFRALDVALDATGEALAHPISYVKPGSGGGPGQVEGISGATISAAAVVRALRNSTDEMLPLIHQHMEQLKGPGQ